MKFSLHIHVLYMLTGFFNEDGSIRHSGPTHSPTGVPTATLEKIGHVFSNVPEDISVHAGTCELNDFVGV